MKGFSQIWLIVGALSIVIIAGVASGVAYYLGRQTAPKSQTPQPSPTYDTSPTLTGAGEATDWSTYSDAEYGFEISYPSNYKLERRGGGSIGLYKKPGTGIFDILIDIWDSQSEYEKQFIGINNLIVKKVNNKYITITGDTDKLEISSIINTFKF